MRYIQNHWRGNHSLPRALLLNFVLIKGLVLYSDRYVLPPYIAGRDDAITATIIFSIICHGLIYVWQIIGLLRSAERQISGPWVWGAYMTLIASFVFTLLAGFGSYQSLTPDKFRVIDPLALEHARANQYSLRVNPGGTQIYLDGIFALGLTDKLTNLLDQNPAVLEIILNSEGGQVYEGRGVAALIKKRNLSTSVFAICKSACATAFIGGARRTLGRSGKLGFHQYRLELWYPIPLFDLKGEQDKEISFYRDQNIDEKFLNQAFKTRHQDIWFPDHNTLLAAGVVHDIVDDTSPAKFK